MNSVVLRFSTCPWCPDSALIRWRTDCNVSHVEYELPDGTTLGSRLWGGIKFRPAKDSAKHNVIRATFDGIEIAYEWLKANRIGWPYDKLGIIGIATAQNWSDKKGRFCSEAILESAQAVGAQLLSQGVYQWQISPRDLLVSPFIKIISGPNAFGIKKPVIS